MKRHRKKHQKTLLTQRDLEILQLLFEHKIISRDQIGLYFFSDVSKRTVNRRLKKILDLGLIRRIPIETKEGTIYGYSITEKGMGKIQSLLPYETNHKGTQSYCPLHDMVLVDIRKAFEARNSVQDYYTENVLQRNSEFHEDHVFHPFIELNSDGVVCIKSQEGVLHVAVEFELHKKSMERYKQKLDDYYWKRSVTGVFYICSHEGILDALFNADKDVSKRHSHSSKMYVSLLGNVLHCNDEMTFRNVEDFSIEVR